MGLVTRLARSVGRVVAVVFGLPFLLIGLVVAGGSFLSLVGMVGPGVASMTVDQTTGTVTAVEVERTTANGETVYYPRIEYTYTVNGQQYTSDHLLPPAERVKGPTDYMEFETREAAEEELNFYGGRPTVYYRDSPSKAFLDGPQFSMGSAVGSLVGTLFGLPFLAFGYFLVRWGTGDDEEQAEEAGEAMEGIAEGVESDHDADADDEWGSSDFDGGGGLFDGGGDGGGGFGGDGDGGGGGGGGGVE